MSVTYGRDHCYREKEGVIEIPIVISWNAPLVDQIHISRHQKLVNHFFYIGLTDVWMIQHF